MLEYDILKEACEEAEDSYWENYFIKIDEEPEIEIPIKIRNNILNYIYNLQVQQNRESKTPAKSHKLIRTILIAAILILISVSVACAFSPVRSFIIKVYNDCTEIIFSYDNTDDYVYAYYSYIPEGYELIDDFRGKDVQFLTYTKNEFTIQIDSFKNGNSKTDIDTENAISGEIEINKQMGYYSITNTNIIVVWSTGEYNHCIVADKSDSKLTIEEIIKIVESRNPKK